MEVPEEYNTSGGAEAFNKSTGSIRYATPRLQDAEEAGGGPKGTEDIVAALLAGSRRPQGLGQEAGSLPVIGKIHALSLPLPH